MRDLVGQIAAFVVLSGLLGLGFGVLVGRATHRGRGVRVVQERVVQERVLVRTDVSLYRENEQLRDRVVALRARVDLLEADAVRITAGAPLGRRVDSALSDPVAAEDPRAEDPSAEDPRAEDPRVEDPRAEDPNAAADPAAPQPRPLSTRHAKERDLFPRAMGRRKRARA